MNHLETEFGRIREKINEMWEQVNFQVLSGREALLNGDKLLAAKVIKRGKKVNNYDLKIDRMCENFLALFNPLAVDLRWILAILKINANLERIGDTAEGIAHLVEEAELPFEPKLLEDLRLLEMYDHALQMLDNVRKAFEETDTELAREVIKQDKALDKIHRKTDQVLVTYLKADCANIDQALKAGGIVRKLERVGDQITNIAEEIVFYREAKVVKHKPKKKK